VLNRKQSLIHTLRAIYKTVVHNMKTLGLIFSYLLIAIGFASWFLVPKFFSNENEIPLGDIKGFVIDSKNNIYFGSGFYERVQVYNQDGEFIKNWKVDSHGGTYIIDIAENDNILITTARGDEQIEYDQNGNVIKRKDVNPLQYELKDFNERESFTTNDGTEYLLNGSFITELIKTNPKKTIVKQNLFLQIIKGPTNSWILGVIGILFVNLLSRKKK